MRIAIVSDTSCNFTLEEAEKLGIYVVPMQIIFGNQVYKDAVELTGEKFYKKMEKADELPTTSQPAVGDFIALYQELITQYDKIISIHPSGKLSGTVDTAQLAANQVDANNIIVFDSEMVSILSGYLVRAARHLVANGATVDTILNRLEKMKENTFAYIVLENFDNLARSGRIPNIANRITRAAKIKPILKISAKGIELEKIVRTSKRAIRQLQKKTFKYIEKSSHPVKIDVAHGDFFPAAEGLQQQLSETYPYLQSQINRLAGVIGVHTGPKVIGYTVTQEYTETQ